MLTKESIRRITTEVLTQHGLALCDYLNKSETHHAGQLAAILAIFAEKIEAESSDVVAVIDARMGIGWTRELAEALQLPVQGGER